MRHHRRVALLAIAAAALLLTACASTGGTASAPSTTSAESTPTPTPVAPQASAMVVSLHELTVVDAEGDVLDRAGLTEGDAVVALVRSVLGEPSSTTTDATSPFRSTAWDGLALSTDDGSHRVSVQLSAARSGAIALRSSDGISVGMTRAEVVAAGAVLDASWTDTEANALHESFVSQRETVPDTRSLTRPGQTGSIFVEADVVDGVVAALWSPGDDFSDV